MSNENDVNGWLQILGISDDDVIHDFDHLHKVSKLRYALNKSIKKYESYLNEGLRGEKIYINIAEWFDGIECETLKVGEQGWQKGRVKINLALEFIPDVEEVPKVANPKASESSGARSPLDDIRQMNV